VRYAIVNEGQTLKRWTSASMGRATPWLKRTSHVEIRVGEDGATVTAPAAPAPAGAKTATPAPKRKAKPAAKAKTKARPKAKGKTAAKKKKASS
jgi:hypothetical protein